MVKNLETSRSSGLNPTIYHEQINLFEVVFFMYKTGAIAIKYQNTGKGAKEQLLLKFNAFSPTLRDSNTRETAEAQGHPTWEKLTQKATHHLLVALAISPTQPSVSESRGLLYTVTGVEEDSVQP